MGRACVDAVRPIADVIVAVDLRVPEVDGAFGVACDVADPAAVDALAARSPSRGPFRALVHAAGISPTMGDARRVLEVDLVGTQLLLDAFDTSPSTARRRCASRRRRPTRWRPTSATRWRRCWPTPWRPTSSTAPSSSSPATAASPTRWPRSGCVRAAARAAVRWGRRGARVNSLAPGLIDTPMGRQELDRQPAMRDMLAQTPLGRLGQARGGRRRRRLPRLRRRLVRQRHRRARRRRPAAGHEGRRRLINRVGDADGLTEPGRR